MTRRSRGRLCHTLTNNPTVVRPAGGDFHGPDARHGSHGLDGPDARPGPGSLLDVPSCVADAVVVVVVVTRTAARTTTTNTTTDEDTMTTEGEGILVMAHIFYR